MACLPDPGEAQLAILACFTVGYPVDHEVGVAGIVEGFLTGPLGDFGDGFTSKPVADIVSIAVYEGNMDVLF